jgi:hypothetical protein
MIIRSSCFIECTKSELFGKNMNKVYFPKRQSGTNVDPVQKLEKQDRRNREIAVENIVDDTRKFIRETEHLVSQLFLAKDILSLTAYSRMFL